MDSPHERKPTKENPMGLFVMDDEMLSIAYWVPLHRDTVYPPPNFEAEEHWQSSSTFIKNEHFFLSIRWEHRAYGKRHFQAWTQFDFEAPEILKFGWLELKKKSFLPTKLNHWNQAYRILLNLWTDRSRFELDKKQEIALNTALNTMLLELKYGKQLYCCKLCYDWTDRKEICNPCIISGINFSPL